MDCRVAVLGVVYPAVEKYIADYFQSLEAQNFKEFDLVLVNDGLKDLRGHKDNFNLNIKEINSVGNPAKNRARGINYVKNEGYDFLIFTDCDDFFSENRVIKNMEMLENHDIAVNEVTLVDDKGRPYLPFYASDKIEDCSEIGFDFILNKNLIGFSNAAIRLECLKHNVDFPENLIAVDWHFYGDLLKRGCSSFFTNQTLTFYRIHDANTVGLSSLFDSKKASMGIDVKLLHYELLSEKDVTCKQLKQKYDELKKKISSQRYLDEYVKKVRKLNLLKPLWWEEIKLPEELDQ